MSPKRLAVLSVSALLSRSGLTALRRRLRRARGDYRIFLLEYHGVDPDGREWEGTISQARFRRHLAWLSRRFEMITVQGAAEILATGKLDRDYCVITFDDGYLNNVEGAFPVLQELGLPATIYLTTGFLDGEELWFDVARRALAANPSTGGKNMEGIEGENVESAMVRLKNLPAEERLAAVERMKADASNPAPAARPMSWEQARRLRDAGIELGAHTVTHPILSKLDAAAQEEEIRGSIERMAEELGTPPTTFAIPNGSPKDYDAHTLAIARRLGLKAVCTTRRGSCTAGSDPLELPRLGVGSDTLSLLDARLSGVFDAGVRRILGRLVPSMGGNI